MRISVIGAGSWGTAVTSLLAVNGHDVTMWARDRQLASAITSEHRNPRYLPDVFLGESVCASSDLDLVLADCSAIVMATPSKAIRDVSEMVGACLRKQEREGVPLVILTKGIEAQTLLPMADVVAQALGTRESLAVLSGPNHAEEVSRKIPAATVVAAYRDDIASFFQELFSNDYFRVYTSSDVIGVEVCGASKNVIALAAGMGDGLGFGDNTKASLITRGLAEMRRLVAALGGNEFTCMGLAGMGDLIATCISKHSRNRLFGEMIASGKTIEDFEKETHMVAEGAYATLSVTDLARAHDVEVPIMEGVRGILYEGGELHDTLQALMTRLPKSEL